MGNKFTSVLPSMFLGNAKNSDGTFATEQSALTNLTVMYACAEGPGLILELTWECYLILSTADGSISTPSPL
jgi:hypothetical protein